MHAMGDTIGYFIPARSKRSEAALAAKGISEEEISVTLSNGVLAGANDRDSDDSAFYRAGNFRDSLQMQNGEVKEAARKLITLVQFNSF
jgi:hypothetical protein